jgi:hypothetical protein
MPHAVSQAANFMDTRERIARNRIQLCGDIPQAEQRNAAQADCQYQ